MPELSAAERHRSLLVNANVSTPALSELTSRKCAPHSVPRKPGNGVLRVLNWNILADGLSDDGFTVNDVLAGGTPAETDKMVQDLMATKARGGDMQALRAKYANERTKSNLDTVIDWPTRWSRMLAVIEKMQPDVITVEELDHMDEAQRTLRALGYECSVRQPPAKYVPAHTAVDGGTIDAAQYLAHLERVGVAFAPKSPSNARKFALKSGVAAADADDDGVAIFWRSAVLDGVSLSFLALPDKKQHKSLVRVRLERRADRTPLYVIVAHLSSGTSEDDEATRIEELQAPSLNAATGQANGPSTIEWLRASMAEAPTLFCLDANSAPDRSESVTVWRQLRSLMPSVWDQHFDARGRKLVDGVVVTSNKLRGPESTQLKKIGEHVCLVRGTGPDARACGSHCLACLPSCLPTSQPPSHTRSAWHWHRHSPAASHRLRSVHSPLRSLSASLPATRAQVSDYIYYSPRFRMLGHAVAPTTFPSEPDALRSLLPSLSVPSDHHPVACDFELPTAVRLRSGVGSSTSRISPGGLEWRVASFDASSLGSPAALASLLSEAGALARGKVACLKGSGSGLSSAAYHDVSLLRVLKS